MDDLSWQFPLSSTHAGIPLGNGRFGALVWGGDTHLRITLGLTDLWDHRGGVEWTPQQTYQNIRNCLQAGDEERLRELFAHGDREPGTPARPTVLPLGRVDLHFPEGVTLTDAILRTESGELAVHMDSPNGNHTVRITMHPAESVLGLRTPVRLPDTKVCGVPAWDFIDEYLESVGYAPPEKFTEGDVQGWVLDLPEDPAVCVAWQASGGNLHVTTARATAESDARSAACQKLDSTAYPATNRAADEWWTAYWEDVPEVDVPNEVLQHLYDYGMYKFAGMTNPSGVPSGLQGPWIEEYDLPPWSADYHFNINVQMCYWPAYRGNRLEHLRPLWEMISGWHDRLEANARMFAGIEDGYMLPHAVDDRCKAMGGYWTGHIDHGCTAWVARMMFRYYRYTMDEEFLRETAWPFMQRAMRVYREMLEEDEHGALRLPVSVSPEYRGASSDAWGENASFQLAAIHRLVEDMQDAAEVLDEEPDPFWAEVQARLPRATLTTWKPHDSFVLGPPRDREVIGLWKGQDLAASHRHHSHMAALHPFDVIDPHADEWASVVEETFRQWVFRGMGAWSGWCIPWASIMHTRIGNGDMAELLLEIFERVYTNEGGNTFHDPRFPGFSLMGAHAFGLEGERWHRERMQVDAQMAAVTAVQEMLLSTRRGVNYLFAGAPDRWQDVSFDGMRTDGAFLLSAARHAGRVQPVSVQGPAGGTFRLGNPWQGPARISRNGRPAEEISGNVLEFDTSPGEEIRIAPA